MNLRIPERYMNVSGFLVDISKIIPFYGSNSVHRKECSEQIYLQQFTALNNNISLDYLLH